VISRRREEGAVAIIVALLLVVFMAAVALTVDVGGLYLRRRALVNGSDAAALSAARTCSRGVGNDPQFASTEEAADVEVQANAPITTAEVSGPTPNVTYPPPGGCALRTQYGHVTVQYTSEQALYFAPVLGFNKESPVTTTATASWGLGSNNPIPLAFGGKLLSSCPVPPNGEPTTSPPQVCATWYDNDDLNDGNFGFLTLDPKGWDVAPTYQGCNNPGTNQLTDWINGTDPASVTLNWTLPTYVCSSSGFHNGGSGQQGFDALRQLTNPAQIRDFPIVWEGWSVPTGSSTVQGSIYQSNKIDKYDVIGFAALKILSVLRPSDAAGTPAQNGTCSRNNINPAIPAGTYTWITFGSAAGCNANQVPPSVPVDQISGVSISGFTGTDYSFDTTGITLNKPIPKGSSVSFTWHFDPKPGPCGPVPGDNSAMCVVTEWHGSTLTGDYDQNLDNITVVRLCDLAYTNSCLDQRPR
jgi:Flp pilus assembly protein TadG